jgi:hypothetical protein
VASSSWCKSIGKIFAGALLSMLRKSSHTSVQMWPHPAGQLTSPHLASPQPGSAYLSFAQLSWAGLCCLAPVPVIVQGRPPTPLACCSLAGLFAWRAITAAAAAPTGAAAAAADSTHACTSTGSAHNRVLLLLLLLLHAGLGAGAAASTGCPCCSSHLRASAGPGQAGLPAVQEPAAGATGDERRVHCCQAAGLARHSEALETFSSAALCMTLP